MKDSCPHCGLTYAEMRTGYTYRDVFQMLWSPSEDSQNWKYKGRHMVLGKWHQLKQDQWRMHLGECELYSQVVPLAANTMTVPF